MMKNAFEFPQSIISYNPIVINTTFSIFLKFKLFLWSMYSKVHLQNEQLVFKLFVG